MPRPIPAHRSRARGFALTVAIAVGIGVACSDSSGTSGEQADLVTVLTGPAKGKVGDTLTFVLVVRNDGPDAAAAAASRVTLTGGLTFQSASGGGTESGGTIAWPTVGSIAAGDSVVLGFDLRVGSTGAASLTSSATSNTPDPKSGNNNGSGTASRLAITVTAAPSTADLQVSLSGTLSGANGDTVTATVTVMNAGPIAAKGVSVFLAIPDPVAAVVTSTEPATRQNGKITWALGSLALNETRQLGVKIVIPVASTTALTVSGASTTPDPAASNNNGTATNAKASVRAVLVPLRTLTGEAVGDQFGWLTENIGDLNGDGIADFVTTAPTNNAGGALAGRVYVYSGASGTELFRVTGTDANGQLGFSADVAGDIDGDGTTDLILGAPAINTAQPGYVLLVSGKNGSLLRRINGVAGGEGFGYAVGHLGDLNGDGVPDVVIGAPIRSPGGIGAAGAVVVVSGATGATLAVLPGTVSAGLLGVAVRGIGDIDQDGTPDFAAGAMGEPGGGRIHVISGIDGADLVPPLSAPSGGVAFGQFWSYSPGDLDGDGTADIFGADFDNGTGGALRGSAYVFSGKTGGLIRTFLGEKAGDQFGIGRGIGDITGDGRPDFILAAWQRSEGAVTSGKVYLLDGATGAELRTFISLTPNETLGFDAIGLGDVNGDGLPDYVVTGGQNINQGKVYVVAGVPLP